MDPDPTSELETRLRAMHWRAVPDDALALSLKVAQEGLTTPTLADGASPPLSRLNRLLPGPVRWTLAACWALSLGLRLATPASPAVAEDAGAPVNGAAVFEAMKQTKKQIHEFELELALVRR